MAALAASDDFDGSDPIKSAHLVIQNGGSGQAAQGLSQMIIANSLKYAEQAKNNAQTFEANTTARLKQQDMLSGHIKAVLGASDTDLPQAILDESKELDPQHAQAAQQMAQQLTAGQLSPSDARMKLKALANSLLADSQQAEDALKNAQAEKAKREALYGTGPQGDYIAAHLQAQNLQPTPQNIAKMQEQYNKETKIDPGVARMSILLQRPIAAVDANGNPILATQAQAANAANAGSPMGAPQYNVGVQGNIAAGKEAVKGVPVIQTALHHLDQMDTAASALSTGNVKALNEIAKAYQVQVGDTPMATYRGIQQVIRGDILAASSAVGTKNENEEKAIDDITNPANPVKAIHASIGAVRQLMYDRLAAKGEVYKQAKQGGDIFTPQTAPQGGGVSLDDLLKAHPPRKP